MMDLSGNSTLQPKVLERVENLKHGKFNRAAVQKQLREMKLKATGTNAELLSRLHTSIGNNGNEPPNNPNLGENQRKSKSKIKSNVNSTSNKSRKSPLKCSIVKELVELGAKTTGLKDTLKKRLALWKENKLNRTLIEAPFVPSITKNPMPPDETFIPLKQLPKRLLRSMTMQVIDEWFVIRSAKKGQVKGRELFLHKYCKNVRVSPDYEGKVISIKTEGASACKKKGEYSVDMCVGTHSSDFEILQATCQCPAGEGFSAACKHVAAVCYCLEHFSICGDVIQFESCTSQTQVWHKPPPAGRNLKPGTANELLGEILPQIDSSSGTDTFLNTLINYTCSSAILHCRAVNPIAYLHDYGNITSLPLEVCIVDEINNITVSYVTETEKKTRKQSSSKLWREVRCSRITASVIGDICTTVRCGNFSECYAKSQVKSKDLSKVPAIIWGRNNEQVAIMKYEEVVGCEVKKCGIFIDEGTHFIAGSPDGVADGVLLEVKCPYSVRHQKPQEANFLKSIKCGSQKLYFLKRSHKYYFQCQVQMHVAKVKKLDFVVWTTEGIFIENIKYRPDFCEKLMCYVDQYYRKVFARVYVTLKWNPM